jgi:anti-sigma factor ChrR (cupin superfamily)
MSELTPYSVALAELAKATDGYEPFRPGIEIRPLYRTLNGPAAAVLRYVPGATLANHSHDGYEHIFVLEGEQSDERGTYGAGSFIVNPPGTGHSVTSRTGCVVLVIWEKQPRFEAPAASDAPPST